MLEAPSPHEVRLTSLETNPVFRCLGNNFSFIELIELVENYPIELLEEV